MFIAVDFDGTCVTHDYPEVGEDIGAAPVLRKLIDAGHKIILNTMRSGKELEDAEHWFKLNNISLFGSNINPTQKRWTDSPKVYANLYIDDAALGCPLTIDSDFSDRPFVDWEVVDKMLKDMSLYE